MSSGVRGKAEGRRGLQSKNTRVERRQVGHDGYIFFPIRKGSLPDGARVGQEWDKL